MGLFGSSKTSKTKSSKKVRPTVVRTENVAKELFTVAKSYDVKIELLDFTILEVQTYTRIIKENAETDWEESSADELCDLDDETALMNKDFEIKQMYEVEIFLKSSDELKDFKVAIGANSTKCKIYLSIASGSKVHYYNNLENDVNELINKSKIRAGILVGLFDKVQEKSLDKLVSYIRVNEEVVYEKAQTILVAEGYEPTPTTDDELILHFENTQEAQESEKVDYASRGFIKSVKEDELLIEYVKPKEGKPGRNCRGEYMDPHEPTVENEPDFTTDDSIKMLDEENSILYKATHSGYIAFENNVYTVAEEMDVGEISFKTTGNIKAGLDSEVTLNVKENDVMKDAIGNGMQVEVTEIDIEGNVGSNSIVTAMRATVSGQTHKTAVLNVEDLTIDTHRGTANGKKITINRLEHGTVNGESVEISQATGGDIRAKDIEIDVCMSYVKATASRRIEITSLKGSENVFTIDPLLQKTANEGFEENQDEIADLETSIDKLKKDIEKYTELVKKDIPAFNDVKKKLIHYKKQGIKMPNAFVNKYKQFVKVQEHLKSIKNTHKIKEDKYALLTTKTASFQDNIFNARIINRDKWTEHNELIFKLVDPPIELSFKPQEGSPDKIFAIVELEDGAFKIQAVKE